MGKKTRTEKNKLSIHNYLMAYQRNNLVFFREIIHRNELNLRIFHVVARKGKGKIQFWGFGACL